MTVIEVYRHNGIPCGVKASGHSGYAEAGSDIVCAAVSVLMQTLHIGLSDILSVKPRSRADAESALIELSWPAEDGEGIRVLTETVFRALLETAHSYENYVKYVEVSL